MYTTTNYQTKKALKEDFKAGKKISVFQAGPFAGKTDGAVCIEGPHYPQPHKWYASVVIKDSIIVAIKG